VVSHELSHYALGHKGSRNRKDISLRDLSSSQVKHEESEANRLAVILLAPEHLIPEDASADEIASMFSLNMTAAILRKDEVDRIRRRRRGELRPLPASIKEMLRNARDEGFPIQTQLDD
jgi:Zn-dependent peptidase ImmA (M78 family)